MLLETLQNVNLTVETYIEFVQQLEFIKKCITNHRTKEKRTAQTNTKFYANTAANGMLGKNNFSDLGKKYSICIRKNHD